jgi:aminoglycoside phosphotransferase (APT) family kinase protein
MAPIDLAELPPALAEHVTPRARLTFPPQGATSNVAFAEHEGRVVVVKRCGHRIYLDWLRREHVVLRALADSGLPIPRFIAYAEVETGGQTVGWLLMSRLTGSRLFSAAIEASPAAREAQFRRLGELVRRLHATRVPREVQQSGSWLSRQIEEARKNLPWCDGTAAGLAELERSRPAAVPETLIHGDLDLANVLIDERGELGLIDWAGGGSGDPRHDVALALDLKPELELSRQALDAFYSGYGCAALDEQTREWFVRLYDFF